MTKDADALEKYKECKVLFRKESQKLRANEEEDVVNKQNSKCFFRFLNSRLKNSKTAPFLIDDSNVTYSDDNEKAEFFNNYFASVFTNDNGLSPYITYQDTPVIEKIVFDENSVFLALKNTNASLSVDPDGLCAYFLKKSSFSICKPLAHIFMISYETGNIPDF